MTSTGTRPSALPGQEHPERLFTPNFLLASLLTFAAFASFYLLLATLPVYIIQIGGRESEVGLVIGSFSLTAILLRLYVGRAADQRGRKPFILAGTAVLVLCSGLYTLIRSVPALLALRVVHGAGWASFGTATNTLVADLAPRSRRGAAMGYFGMFSNLAMAVGPALGVWLMNGYGFDILFMVATGTALLAFLMSLAVSEPAGRRQPPPAAQAGSSQGFIEHSALFPSLVLTLTTVTYGSIVSFLPIYAARQGVDNPGIFFTAYAVVLIVARGFTGHLSDRYGRAAVIAPGLLLAAAGLLVLSTATTMAALLLVALLYGLAFAAVQPALMAMVVDRAAPHRRGAAMGTFSTAMDLGIGGGSVVWGFVAQGIGYQGMYLASCGVALVALAVFLAGNRGDAQSHRE